MDEDKLKSDGREFQIRIEFGGFYLQQINLEEINFQKSPVSIKMSFSRVGQTAFSVFLLVQDKTSGSFNFGTKDIPTTEVQGRYQECV